MSVYFGLLFPVVPFPKSTDVSKVNIASCAKLCSVDISGMLSLLFVFSFSCVSLEFVQLANVTILNLDGKCDCSDLDLDSCLLELEPPDILLDLIALSNQSPAMPIEVCDSELEYPFLFSFSCVSFEFVLLANVTICDWSVLSHISDLDNDRCLQEIELPDLLLDLIAL